MIRSKLRHVDNMSIKTNAKYIYLGHDVGIVPHLHFWKEPLYTG